jgi:hypothetical protein
MKKTTGGFFKVNEEMVEILPSPSRSQVDQPPKCDKKLNEVIEKVEDKHFQEKPKTPRIVNMM